MSGSGSILLLEGIASPIHFICRFCCKTVTSARVLGSLPVMLTAPAGRAGLALGEREQEGLGDLYRTE